MGLPLLTLQDQTQMITHDRLWCIKDKFINIEPVWIMAVRIHLTMLWYGMCRANPQIAHWLHMSDILERSCSPKFTHDAQIHFRSCVFQAQVRDEDTNSYECEKRSTGLSLSHYTDTNCWPGVQNY